jgi:hypothetical protein
MGVDAAGTDGCLHDGAAGRADFLIFFLQFKLAIWQNGRGWTGMPVQDVVRSTSAFSSYETAGFDE